MVSAIAEQREIILNAIKGTTPGEWKVLVVDEDAKKLIDNVVKEDDILNENIANIEMIDQKRDMNPDMDAIYILSPQPHIVDCLMADFERRRYRRAYLMWTTLLNPQLRHRIDASQNAQRQIATFETLSIDYYPRESHLITFRDPWSFPILYHPACNNLVRDHMMLIAQKITGICISLGEYPKVRYYKPRNPTHEASVLCGHLARFVQEELDGYMNFNGGNWPPPSNRPQGVLVITDRAMDLYSPLVHEFTYQAMAHDLLPIKDGDKTTYTTLLNEGQSDEEMKELEIGEKDKVWVENRHMHMKDTIEKLMDDFKKFIAENPHFTNTEDAASLNAIKDMLAGLPQFQEMKETYNLHLSMAQECMNIFQHHKLPDIASVEQSVATGLDEDFRKPKNLADQLVRLLDDESIGPQDRLRLIMLFVIYREGMIPDDIQRLLAHASLPPQDAETIDNLNLLGAHTTKGLKDPRPVTQPLFPRKTAPTAQSEEYALSRYEPMLKLMLEDLAKFALDQSIFPYTKPPTDNSEQLAVQANSSLRSAKPTWARNRMSVVENRQRVIVFMAGGATFAEARTCYEVAKTSGRDIFLATSHMLTPKLFVKQVSDLSADRRRLDLPIDRPKKKAPDHLFQRNDPPPMILPSGSEARQPGMAIPGRPGGALPRSPGPPAPPQKSPGYDRPAPTPPVAQMAAVSMNSNTGPISLNGANGGRAPPPKGKLEKKSKYDENGEKKKKGFFGRKK